MLCILCSRTASPTTRVYEADDQKFVLEKMGAKVKKLQSIFLYIFMLIIVIKNVSICYST